MKYSKLVVRSQGQSSPELGRCCAGGGLWRWGGALLGVSLFALLAVSLAWLGRVEAREDAPSRQVSAGGSSLEAGAESVTAENAADEAAADQDEVIWWESYRAALTEAAKKDKPVLVRFSATWCMPCQVMDRTVWPDETVRSAIAGNFIPVKLDVDYQANAETVRRYGVRAVPTLLIVDASGEELARSGFMGTESMVEFLHQAGSKTRK